MQRETKELTTQNGHAVTTKAWLNKGEELELMKFFASRANEKDGEYSVTDAGAMIDYYKLLVSIWVLTLDGENENILEKMLELRPADYDEVIAFITANKEKTEEKKTSDLTNIGDLSEQEKQI
jgi:hypothetical protein